MIEFVRDIRFHVHDNRQVFDYIQLYNVRIFVR